MIDDNSMTNRSELIKRARESCNRSIADDNTYSSNYKVLRSPRADNSKMGEDVLKAKFFVIRLVIAAVILLSVIFVDKLEITYKHFSSNQISKMLHSNNLYNMAKGYADKIFNGDKKEEANNEEKNEDNIIEDDMEDKVNAENKTPVEESADNDTEEDVPEEDVPEDETEDVLNIEE